MIYNTEPLNSNLRVEEPRARQAHHRANPFERKHSPEEVRAACLSRALLQ